MGGADVADRSGWGASAGGGPDGQPGALVMDAEMTTLAALLKVIRQLAEVSLSLLQKPAQATQLVFSFVSSSPIQFHIGVKKMKLTDVQKVIGSIAPKDAAGNPAPVDGIPVWASSDTAVITVTAAPDGMSAVVEAVGPLGTAQVSVSADADTGEGVTTITALVDIEVLASEATALGITFGVPEAK